MTSSGRLVSSCDRVHQGQHHPADIRTAGHTLHRCRDAPTIPRVHSITEVSISSYPYCTHTIHPPPPSSASRTATVTSMQFFKAVFVIAIAFTANATPTRECTSFLSRESLNKVLQTQSHQGKAGGWPRCVHSLRRRRLSVSLSVSLWSVHLHDTILLRTLKLTS
jgi:hypothetical protein